MGRRSFSPEFKQEAVKLVTEQNRSATAVARELGVAQSTLSAWLRLAPAASGPASLSDAERLELAALRREVRTLRMEREILKKAAAFFAKENA